MRWKHGMMALLTVALLAGLVGCSSKPAPKLAPTLVAAKVTPDAQPSSVGGMVKASGEIIPAQRASLGFPVGGRVQKIHVAEGDIVHAGDVLITLETAQLEAQAAGAKAALAAAQAQLAQLKAGARPGEITAAEQAVEQADAAVRVASSQLAQLRLSTQSLIAAAEAELAQAQANLKIAQDAYDGVSTGRSLAKEYGVKGHGLGQAEEQMRIQLAAVRTTYEAAQIHLEEVKAGVTKNELSVASARLAAAQAQKAQAQAQLELLQVGATAEQIAIAEANIAQAQAAADMAQAALDQARLNAPFPGTVAALQVNPGEMVTPGQIVLALADLSRLQGETTDLSEQDVSRVAVGDSVTVFVKALGKEIKGRVVRIAPRAAKVGGDVVYTVVAELDEQPAGLRWGMSVDVEVETK